MDCKIFLVILQPSVNALTQHLDLTLKSHSLKTKNAQDSSPRQEEYA